MSKQSILYVAHSSSFDFQAELYQPLRQSSLNKIYQIILPHESSLTPQPSKNQIQQADIIIAEVSYPSTGMGIELGWANELNKRIICIYKAEMKYSSSLSLITQEFIAYQNAAELITLLMSQLSVNSKLLDYLDHN